jgi:hypothetical protein
MKLFDYRLSRNIWGYQIAIPLVATASPRPSLSYHKVISLAASLFGPLACCLQLRTFSLTELRVEHPFECPLPPMVRRYISDDIKEMALSMSLQGISDSEIRELTGVSERSLKRLRSVHRQTGAVSSRPIDVGWPRILSAMAVQVRHTQEYAHYRISPHLIIVSS